MILEVKRKELDRMDKLLTTFYLTSLFLFMVEAITGLVSYGVGRLLIAIGTYLITL